tara:strand:- start:244 stop:861 length:618 start_codon:yes stop_codon:yes gene_type:complete
MPAVSKAVIVETVFSALAEIEDFPYTNEELYGFLKQTEFKIPKKTDSIRATSAYDCFLKENKSGKGFGDNSSLKELWTSIKSNPDEFEKYQNIANDANIKKGLPVSKNPLSANSKLISQLISLKQENSTLHGKGFEIKPHFYGKKPHTSTNNYKQWKLSSLSLPPSHVLSKHILTQYKIDDNFDPKIYTSSQPWYNFISTHMIHI